MGWFLMGEDWVSMGSGYPLSVHDSEKQEQAAQWHQAVSDKLAADYESKPFREGEAKDIKIKVTTKKSSPGDTCQKNILKFPVVRGKEIA